jgi:hypothetical protein
MEFSGTIPTSRCTGSRLPVTSRPSMTPSKPGTKIIFGGELKAAWGVLGTNQHFDRCVVFNATSTTGT